MIYITHTLLKLTWRVSCGYTLDNHYSNKKGRVSGWEKHSIVAWYKYKLCSRLCYPSTMRSRHLLFSNLIFFCICHGRAFDSLLCGMNSHLWKTKRWLLRPLVPASPYFHVYNRFLVQKKKKRKKRKKPACTMFTTVFTSKPMGSTFHIKKKWDNYIWRFSELCN